MTVSMTVYSSYMPWFCLRTLMRALESMYTAPEVDSTSPESTRRKVDLPAPLAPMMP